MVLQRRVRRSVSTAALRRYARSLHKQMAADQALLLDVAERLFASPVLEEKALAVTMLQRSLVRFGSAEFRRLETWLGQVVSWADRALAMLQSAMVAAGA
jgi:hypothetical protein